MPPALAQKTELRDKRRKASFENDALDTWSPLQRSPQSPKRFKRPRRQNREHLGSLFRPGPSFQSPALTSGRGMREKIRGRVNERQQTLPHEFVALVPSSVRGKMRARLELSTPAPLDRAASQLNQLIGKEHIADEDLIKTARSLREAMKAELHSDPPMADVCLVIADALTFSAAEQLDLQALRALDNAFLVLVKPQADESDARRIFSSLIQGGWRVTPAFAEDEFRTWVENIPG